MASGSLSDLVEAAAGSEVPVDELLRRLKVVSIRAGLPALDSWVQLELNGYGENESLPDYRGPFETMVLGHFVGPMNSSIKNIQLARTSFPESWSNGLWSVSFTQGVARLAEWGAESTLRFSWPPEVVAYADHLRETGHLGISTPYSFVEAHQAIDVSVIAGVLQAIRDRVLTLALGIERENPAMGAPGGPQADSDLNRAVHVIVQGGTANLALHAQSISQQSSFTLTGANHTALLDRLRAAGVGDADISELEVAIRTDEQAGTQSGQLGRETQGWLAKLAQKSGDTLASTTISTVTSLLLTHFLGNFPS